jgi:hypothetical protein
VIRVYPACFLRWPVAALRLRLGAYASAACETARSVAVEPWLWNRGGGTQTALAAAVRSHWATPHASGFVCMCWVCVLARLRAAPTPATPMPWPQTAATSLSRETIHGTNMLICRTCDCAEHASLLRLLSKLPPRIRRLTLRWDAMDMF